MDEACRLSPASPRMASLVVVGCIFHVDRCVLPRVFRSSRLRASHLAAFVESVTYACLFCTLLVVWWVGDVRSVECSVPQTSAGFVMPFHQCASTSELRRLFVWQDHLILTKVLRERCLVPSAGGLLTVRSALTWYQAFFPPPPLYFSHCLLLRDP